jgi:hypothetical protein
MSREECKPTVVRFARIEIPANGCIMLGSFIEPQVDPAKIVGVAKFDPSPGPELPPVPEPGFYWAKPTDCSEWTVVRVAEWGTSRSRDVDCFGWAPRSCRVAEWGPRLEPPNDLPLTNAELRGMTFAGWHEIARDRARRGQGDSIVTGVLFDWISERVDKAGQSEIAAQLAEAFGLESPR